MAKKGQKKVFWRIIQKYFLKYSRKIVLLISMHSNGREIHRKRMKVYTMLNFPTRDQAQACDRESW